jgi:radical SAM protein with 4Fe4S-binding SPASM domain
MLRGFKKRISSIKKELSIIRQEDIPEPKSIQLEPTTKCNLHCFTCTRHTFPPSRLNRSLTLDEFKYITESIPSLKKIKIQGMGEPFLNPHFWGILEYGILNGIKFKTVTNGTMINEGNARSILECCTDIVVSLDSAAKKQYETIRKGANYEKVINGIRLLVNMKKELKSTCKVRVSFVVTHLNYEELSGYFELCEGMGVDIAGVVEVENWLVPIQDQYPENRRFIENSRKMRDKISECIIQHKNKIQIAYSGSERRMRSCMWPKTSCFLTVDGYVTPCCIRPDPTVINFGNIFKNSFSEIWNSKKYKEFRYLNSRGKNNVICESCPD